MQILGDVPNGTSRHDTKKTEEDEINETNKTHMNHFETALSNYVL